MHKKAMLSLVALAIILLLIPGMAFGQADTNPEFNQNVARAEIINTVSGNEEYGTSEYLSPSEIEILRIVKVYIDTNVFALEANGFDAITGALETGNYIYVVYFSIDGKLFDADMSVGQMPSEETIQRIREREGEYAEQIIAGALENAGKWHITRYGMHDSPIDLDYYEQAAAASGITDREPIFVGGLPQIRYPVALYSNELGEIDVIVPLSRASFPWEKLGMDRPEDPVALDYAEVKEMINSLPSGDIYDELEEFASTDAASPSSLLFPDGVAQDSAPSPKDASKQPFTILPFAIVVAVVAAVVAIIVIRRRQTDKRKRDDE
jgi:hypothetical protein